MKKYMIDITPKALSNMEGIYNYIALDLLSPDNAIKQYNRIVDAIFTLEELPARIKIMESAFGQERTFRQLIVDNFSVIYVIDNDHVVITDVLYSASDIDHRLRE